MKKTNPIPKKKLWFRAKNYGWGWYPSSWQGWVTILVFVILEVINSLRIDNNPYSASSAIIFTFQTIIMILVLIYICYKTGEKPSWRWGNRKPGKL